MCRTLHTTSLQHILPDPEILVFCLVCTPLPRGTALTLHRVLRGHIAIRTLALPGEAHVKRRALKQQPRILISAIFSRTASSPIDVAICRGRLSSVVGVRCRLAQGIPISSSLLHTVTSCTERIRRRGTLSPPSVGFPHTDETSFGDLIFVATEKFR